MRQAVRVIAALGQPAGVGIGVFPRHADDGVVAGLLEPGRCPVARRQYAQQRCADAAARGFAAGGAGEARVLVATDRSLRRGEHAAAVADQRSEEHTSELQSLMRISYAVFCLKKKKIYDLKTIDSSIH